MQASIIRFHETGSPDVLKLETVEVPPPGEGEVLIKVRALGLNRAEAMFRSGQYLEQPKFPARIGYEAAGIVEAIGPNVTAVKPGDSVSTAPAFSMNQYGVYGELALVPAAAVMKHPASLSFEQAAAVWMQYLTAYGALIAIAEMKKGDFVVIPAASSSVGVAASQLANSVGAIPIGVTRTSKKRDALKTLGFAHIVASEEEDIAGEIGEITGGRGARIVFDPVGGPTVAKLTAAMSPGGILFQYGALSTEPTPLPLMDVLGKSLTVRGYLLFEFTSDQAKLRRAEDFVAAGLASGKLTPIISKVFPLSEIVEAHRYLESNTQIGKVVVTV